MTGDPRTEVFVLQPQIDMHARKAIICYAKAVKSENPELAAYLTAWVGKLYYADSTKRIIEPDGTPFPEWLTNPGADIPDELHDIVEVRE